MRVGYIISPYPLWCASGVRVSSVCVRECVCDFCGTGLLGGFPRDLWLLYWVCLLGGAVHKDEPLCCTLFTSDL